MNGVRVYMRAGWKGPGSQSGDVTKREYENATYAEIDKWLFINSAEGEEMAMFPPGEWVCMERY